MYICLFQKPLRSLTLEAQNLKNTNNITTIQLTSFAEYHLLNLMWRLRQKKKVARWTTSLFRLLLNHLVAVSLSFPMANFFLCAVIYARQSHRKHWNYFKTCTVIQPWNCSLTSVWVALCSSLYILVMVCWYHDVRWVTDGFNKYSMHLSASICWNRSKTTRKTVKQEFCTQHTLLLWFDARPSIREPPN